MLSIKNKAGDLAALKYWIEEQDFYVDEIDFYSNTLLYYSALCGHLHLIKYLLEWYSSSSLPHLPVVHLLSFPLLSSSFLFLSLPFSLFTILIFFLLSFVFPVALHFVERIPKEGGYTFVPQRMMSESCLLLLVCSTNLTNQKQKQEQEQNKNKTRTKTKTTKTIKTTKTTKTKTNTK